MKSLIYRHTTYANSREVTTIFILGVPIFKRVIIDKGDKPRRACGFNVFASDAPGIFRVNLMMKMNSYGEKKD